jgi:hypothetical protein
LTLTQHNELEALIRAGGYPASDATTLNWVSEHGGRRGKIKQLADQPHRERGIKESPSIATAVAATERFCVAANAG